MAMLAQEVDRTALHPLERAFVFSANDILDLI